MRKMNLLLTLILGGLLLGSSVYAANTTPADNSLAPAKVPSSTAVNNAVKNTALVNINTATVDQLTTVKGLGNSKAQAIVSYREKNGSFNKIEDLLNVPGIGDKILDKIKPQLTV